MSLCAHIKTLPAPQCIHHELMIRPQLQESLMMTMMIGSVALIALLL